MICKTCGEVMSGDGYTSALRCPNVDASDREPDADPLHCTEQSAEFANEVVAQAGKSVPLVNELLGFGAKPAPVASPCLRFLGDKALVKLLPVAGTTTGGIVLPEMYVGNRLSQFGEILALGDGRDPEGNVDEWDVEVGQVIVFGEWVNRPFQWQGEDYHLVYQHEMLAEVIGMAQDSTL